MVVKMHREFSSLLLLLINSSIL